MSAAAVPDVLFVLDSAWRRYGVPAAWRRALAADIEPDLHAATADGTDPAALLAPDPAAFAKSVADEAGVPRVRPELARCVVVFLAAATAAFFLGWPPTVAVLSGVSSVSADDAPTARTVALLVASFGVLGLVCLIAGLWALAVALRGREQVRQTVVRAALLLPILAVAVVPTALGFARATDFSTSTAVVLTELVMVYGSVAAGVTVARRWALRGALD